MRRIFIMFFAVFIILTSISAFSKTNRNQKDSSAIGGVTIPELGLVVDASYDESLDNYVEGYKMVNVALLNGSFNIVSFNPDKDKWYVKSGKKHIEVIHDLRKSNPKLWNSLSDKKKTLLIYPLAMPIGASQVIDLFVPNDVDLTALSEIKFHLNNYKLTKKVSTRQ